MGFTHDVEVNEGHVVIPMSSAAAGVGEMPLGPANITSTRTPARGILKKRTIFILLADGFIAV
jgi:hypothetical protein